MKQVFPRALLVVSGLLLLIVGAAVLFNPISFAASNGVEIAQIPSVLSEYRAPGGLLLVSATLILISATRAQLTRVGLTLSALVYSSYGVARLVGLVLDGVPSAALIQAMIVELLLGSACLAVLLMLNRNPANNWRH